MAVEHLYKTIHEEHLLLNHGGRDIMQKKITGKYANVTVELINIYKDTCIKCGLKKSRVRKGVVVYLYILTQIAGYMHIKKVTGYIYIY